MYTYLIWCRVVRSRDVHPCYMVSRCPVPRFRPTQMCRRMHYPLPRSNVSTLYSRRLPASSLFLRLRRSTCPKNSNPGTRGPASPFPPHPINVRSLELIDWASCWHSSDVRSTSLSLLFATISDIEPAVCNVVHTGLKFLRLESWSGDVLKAIFQSLGHGNFSLRSS